MLLRYTAHEPSLFVSTQTLFFINSLSSNGKFNISLGDSTRCDWNMNPIPCPTIEVIAGGNVNPIIIVYALTIELAI